MNFEKIPGRKLRAEFQLLDDHVKVREQDVLNFQKLSVLDGTYSVRTNDGIFDCRLLRNADVKSFEESVLTGMPYLARITSFGPEGVLRITFCLFDGRCETLAPIEVGVDERIIENVRKKSKRRRTGEVCKELGDAFNYRRDDDSCWFFMIAGPAAESEFASREVEPEPDEDDAYAHPPLTHPDRETSFLVLNDRESFVVSETEVCDNRSIYLMSRYHSRKNASGLDRSLRLTRGELNFTDWTRTGEVAQIARIQLQELVKEAGGYLRKWDEFGDLEGDILLRKARAVGVLTYTSFRAEKDGSLTVFLSQDPKSDWESVTEVECLSAETALPQYLTSPNFSFSSYIQALLEKEDRVKPDVYEVEGVNPGKKEIYLKGGEALPCQNGKLIMSLMGDVIQVKRRFLARKRIDECRSANSQLKLIIEPGGEPAQLRLPRKVQALTPFVKQKIFAKNPPTSIQEEAIRIALNTPDIALIQGPPGTGKTTVITAILERLNEEADKRGSNRGKVLLTGAQHDAVENMISRMSVNSLPVPKFGRRSGVSADDDAERHRSVVEMWCDNLAEKIRSRYPSLKKTEAEAELDKFCLQYLIAPSERLAETILNAVIADTSLIPVELKREAKALLSRQRSKAGDGDLDKTLRMIRNLRVTEAGFSDDGPERAADLKCQLDLLAKEDSKQLDLSALEEAMELSSDMPVAPGLFAKLKDLRILLLQIFAPLPRFKRKKRNVGIERLAKDVRIAIREHKKKVGDGTLFAFAEFLSVLEQYPEKISDALADYSFAYAATCQQSLSKQMASLKVRGSPDNGDEPSEIEYDYVIVDEAARVSPRDLMIPLAQGRRIILVGDHRQLPHVIDEEVARQMEAGEEVESELTWLKKSMFEYLFSERLHELEKRDGITRRITLNMQYRMHPVLGQFISENFYECFNRAERVGSGLDASYFAHNLPDTGGVPVIWVDVPKTCGVAEKSHTGSLFRNCEAAIIRKLYSKWHDSDAGKSFSYGMISFYRAQVEKIRSELQGAQNSHDLRIGTVDSFQGMEFDVVFLSLVRHHREITPGRPDPDEKKAAQIYGFLSLYNRLNVAMSRQKRLLVLIGDAELTRSPYAQTYIPGLVNFRKLCEEKGCVIDGRRIS